MTDSSVRTKYLQFFKQRDHEVIPSASLVPQNDPTTLFTGSGMQPLITYLLGEKHPKGRRLVDSQKCFRAEDIEEVGDNRHTTFFEMLGNWSLGDYFKQEQLSWFFEFLTGEIGLDPSRLYVTVFAGEPKHDIPKDDESVEIWKRLFKQKGIEAKAVMLGSEAQGYQIGMQGGRIFYYDAQKNWWSRAGIPENMPVGEPGGPDSEVFYDFGTSHDPEFGPECHPNCDCGRFIEIGNSVFMEYKKTESGFEKLTQQNVDFGGGLERIMAAQNHNPDVFLTSLFKDIIQAIETGVGQPYEGEHRFPMRIIADHLKGATFMVAEGVEPGNKAQGYIVRRLIRRAVLKLHGFAIDNRDEVVKAVIEQVFKTYQDIYLSLEQLESVTATIVQELEKFERTLKKGLKEFEKYDQIDGKIAFDLLQTYGFPWELTMELAQEKGQQIDEQEFAKEFEKHKERSRSSTAGIFKGGLADQSEQTTKLHTATHLLHAALRNQLGTSVRQEGSHITAERLRFDFSYPEPLTDEQIISLTKEINEKVKADLPVTKTIEKKDEALKSGAVAFFKEKYPEQVSVYTIGSDSSIYSREFCGGPHVTSTGQIGTVTITKQKSIGAGKRRLYATIN